MFIVHFTEFTYIHTFDRLSPSGTCRGTGKGRRSDACWRWWASCVPYGGYLMSLSPFYLVASVHCDGRFFCLLTSINVIYFILLRYLYRSINDCGGRPNLALFLARTSTNTTHIARLEFEHSLSPDHSGSAQATKSSLSPVINGPVVTSPTGTDFRRLTDRRRRMSPYIGDVR